MCGQQCGRKRREPSTSGGQRSGSHCHIAVLRCLKTNRVVLRDLRHFFLSEPTLIVAKPKSMKVIHGSDVRFECGVKADATATVTTTWMKGNRPLTLGWRCIILADGSETRNTQRSTVPRYLELIAFISFFFSVPRISLDESNLIITNVNKDDEGNYTCVIKSELEEKSASARLMVMGMAGLMYYDIMMLSHLMMNLC